MAYRIVKAAQAWWPVEWQGVTDDGSIVTNRIEMRFRLLKVDAGMAFIRDVETAQQRTRRVRSRARGRHTSTARRSRRRRTPPTRRGR